MWLQRGQTIYAYTARILYLPIDACKIGIVNPYQNIDLGKALCMKMISIYIPLISEKKKIVKILVPKDEKVNLTTPQMVIIFFSYMPIRLVF